MPLPYQGNTGGTTHNAAPTLIPNFYGSSMSLRGTLDAKSPAKFAADNPRATSTALVAVGGTVSTGNTVTLTLTQAQLPSGAITYTYTCVASDTIQSVAEELISGLNAAVRTAGGSALVSAIYFTAGAGSTTLEAEVVVNWDGPMGNFAVLSGTPSGSITLTFTPSGGHLVSGSGPVFAANNFNFSYNGTTLVFYYGKPYQLGNDLLAKLAAQDMPVV